MVSTPRCLCAPGPLRGPFRRLKPPIRGSVLHMSTSHGPRRPRRTDRPVPPAQVATPVASPGAGVATASTEGAGPPPGSSMSFADLGVPAPIVRALTIQGIDQPFPIQIATLADTLAGRDVLGRGRTGSGKTLAFAIPMVARLTGGSRRARQPRGLVLVPTRELANQVLSVVEPLARTAGLERDGRLRRRGPGTSSEGPGPRRGRAHRLPGPPRGSRGPAPLRSLRRRDHRARRG